MRVEWRIYYDDETTRDHTEGLPTDEAGKLGIQCVVQRRSSDGRWITHHGAEYYLFVDDAEWINCYHNGLVDWVVNGLDRLSCVLVGRAIPKALLRKILDQAKADADKANETLG